MPELFSLTLTLDEGKNRGAKVFPDIFINDKRPSHELLKIYLREISKSHGGPAGAIRYPRASKLPYFDAF